MNVDASTDQITRTLASFVCATRTSDLPPSARQAAIRALVNIVGCCIGGAGHEIVETAARALMPYAGAQTTTVLGRNARTDPLTATMLNCLSSAAYSFDDTHAQALLHPSGAVATALLALAEPHRISGPSFLLSMILGIDVAARVSKAVSVAPARGNIGWSQTGIAAGIGAAVAAAKALSLTEQQTVWAIGMAALQASGFRAAHGSMSATLIFGHAAQSGLRAAILAQQGFDGPPAPLEGQYGYFSLYAQEAHLAHLTDDLGQRFEVESLTYKPYPCGAVIHPSLDAALHWFRSNPKICAGEIEQVHLQTHPSAMALGFRRHPANVLEAKVSLFHWVAAALAFGRAGVAEGQLEVVNDPRIVGLRERMQVQTDDSVSSDAAIITVVRKHGEKQVVRVDHCKGSLMRPMSDADIDEKFESQARLRLSSDDAAALLKRCRSIEQFDRAADILLDPPQP